MNSKLKTNKVLFIFTRNYVNNVIEYNRKQQKKCFEINPIVEHIFLCNQPREMQWIGIPRQLMDQLSRNNLNSNLDRN